MLSVPIHSAAGEPDGFARLVVVIVADCRPHPAVRPIGVPETPKARSPEGTGPVTRWNGPVPGPALSMRRVGRTGFFQMKSERSLRIAPFGLAPMMLLTGLPPWNTVIVGIDMTW
jgi:hypothetical protein